VYVVRVSYISILCALGRFYVKVVHWVRAKSFQAKHILRKQDDEVTRVHFKTTRRKLFGFLLAMVVVATLQAADKKELPQNVSDAFEKVNAKSDSKGKDASLATVNGPSVCRVEVTPKYMTVSVHAQNVQISTVLQELAVKTKRNIVLASGADRIVSLTFFSVPFKDAMKTMLDANGLAFSEEGDFIIVFTKQELTNRVQGKNGLVTKVFQLNYLRPKDAIQAVKSLISKEGSAKVLEDDPPDTKEADMSLDAAKKQNPAFKPETNRFTLNNALVVHDYRENIEAVSKLVEELDKRPVQILLEATVLEVGIEEKNAFGIDFALLRRTNFLDFFSFGDSYEPFMPPAATGGSANALGPTRSLVVSTPGNTGGGAATIRGGVAVGDFAIFIRALDQITDVSVLSSPKVLSLDRQRARVLIGENVGYLETTVSEGQIIQSVKFLEAGISLDVRPYAMDDGKIRMVLSPKVSKVTFRTITDQNGIVQQIPDEQIQTVAADILVPQGGMAVIGGLFREDTTRVRSQVPVLGDIPIVGALGQGEDDTVDRSELVFIIRPTILSDNELLDIGKTTSKDVSQLLAGSRLGLLPWSKVRQCAQLNLKAARKFRSGDKSQAMWLYRRSLQLRHMQPGVLSKLEHVSRQSPDFTHRGAVYDAIRRRVSKAPGIEKVKPAERKGEKKEE